MHLVADGLLLRLRLAAPAPIPFRPVLLPGLPLVRVVGPLAGAS